jgi:RimJ/RimL family protein N-acetyltransferase
MTIDTIHLRLLPFAPAHLLALIEGDERFEERFGLPAAAGLHAFFASALDEISPAWLASLRTAVAADPWVHGFAVVERASDSVIGSAGFKGPPDTEGMVEIAYGIVPGFQGRGYATEAAQALVAYAFGSGVRLVRAHTLPTGNASTRVLAKCGFHRIGEVVDPEDGRVWRWERTEEAA